MAHGHNTQPHWKTTTIKASSKKRFGVIVDESLLSLMRTVGRRLDALPGAGGAGTGELKGIFLMPTHNILEVYVDPQGRSVGYLFQNIDVWMSFGP